jgi:hypothetical protein
VAERRDSGNERSEVPGNGDFDDLLTPPLPGDRRLRRWAWPAAIAVAVIFVAAAIGLSKVGPGTGAAIPTTTTAGTAATTTTAPAVRLQPYAPDPALLYYPTVLPAGWELCRQLEDISKGDRFCAPDDDDNWLQVSVKDSYQVQLSGTSVPEISNAQWVTIVGQAVLAVPSGQFEVTLIETPAIPDDALVTIAQSIPLIGDRDALYADYELPIDLGAVPEAALADLLRDLDAEPRVVAERPGEAQVFAGNVSLAAFGSSTPALPDLAATIPFPRLIGSDRPLVCGESPSRNRAYAIWDQRGFSWRLEGQLPLDEMQRLALSVIDEVSLLEPAPD